MIGDGKHCFAPESSKVENLWSKAGNFLELMDNKKKFLELVDNFLELVDNKEGEEEDANNDAGGSRLISILRLGGRLILDTFRVGGTNSLEAGPVR